jgi:hypothetical protein
VSPAEAWLRERVPGAPPALLEAMVAALPTDSPSAAAGMAEGALALYRGVVRGSGGREDALPLLAADALLTHAFQAQAEGDPAGLAALAERLGARGTLRGVAP